IERVSALRPPLLAMYAARPWLARSAARLEMLTIEPCPDSTMCGIEARASHIGAVRLTRNVASQRDVVSSTTGPSASSTVDPTALFTSTVSPSNCSTAADTSWEHAASSERSAAGDPASTPSRPIESTTALPRPASRPVTTTRAPSAANATAIAFPRPDVEPVTSAISPSSRTAGTVHRGLDESQARDQAQRRTPTWSSAPSGDVRSCGALARSRQEAGGVVGSGGPAERRRQRCDDEERQGREHDRASGGEGPLTGGGQSEHDGHHADGGGADRRGAERTGHDAAGRDGQHHQRRDEQHTR